MLTQAEYETLTGEIAPDDFTACQALAESLIHAKTLFAYVGRDLTTLPDTVRDDLKLAVALQTLAISQGGGLAGCSEFQPSGMSLGKYSYSTSRLDNQSGEGGASVALSPAVLALMPVLVGYGRGLMV